jgi:hypothetical protein
MPARCSPASAAWYGNCPTRPGLSVEQVLPIRDDIAVRVRALLKELEVS